MTGDLTSYDPSSVLIRNFCSVCGAKVYVQSSSSGNIFPSSGVVERKDVKTLFGSNFHVFVADALDGGISIWFPSSKRWKERDDGAEAEGPSYYKVAKQRKEQTRSGSSSRLSCSCKCGAIAFAIAPPPSSPRDLPADFSAGPYSDLVVPHRSNNAKKDNPDNEAWFLRKHPANPADGDHQRLTRYLAGLCVCRSCRKASGNEFQAWAFISAYCLLTTTTTAANFLNDQSQILDFNELRARGMKTYNSSPGVYRDFCGTCGAVAFWRSDARRDVVDVSVGLMDAPGGQVRAEDWLEWCTDRVSFEEEAENGEVVGWLKEGMQAWNHP
ncbi:uncharacterized protein KY384_005420 [Bacidia gigantensis]|uniref:uncharacterized protein n=1 Tax=Bacidia gigantensis TaxID=2732470 RepID=UPI001D048F38|nr:uncharacterized protein KY384_005420 [Bacidia gigantensis]KAG8529939.1 hypothetical protein KY384_005420 [Bacidia gigantensis]